MVAPDGAYPDKDTPHMSRELNDALRLAEPQLCMSTHADGRNSGSKARLRALGLRSGVCHVIGPALR